MKKVIVFISIVFFSFSAVAQDLHEVEKKENKHFVSITFAQTYIPQGVDMDNLNHKGHLVPGFGIDYLYRLSPKFEIGAMVDYEMGSYIIPHKEDLIRDHAFVLVGVATYTILPNWNIFLGGGVELEKHHNLGVFRMGTEVNFNIGRDWSIPVGYFYDIKEGYDTSSISVGIGKAF
ncbi:hypothetical protein MY04_2925 [Flammeovirga sp. MY04]|uniref:transporter n=1 Tax=Flammeovirga sp. MY04 TaxID=1191459 RepID=UPI000806387C|nr:transporter [Flammeovirga sp. MY04]ANQ50293.1 hypothetical protein MY04_2925 [Flammeovirga sp. MY04]